MHNTDSELERRLDQLTDQRERILCGEREGDLDAIAAEIKTVTTALTNQEDSQ